MKRLITVAVLVIAGCVSPQIESGDFVPSFLRQLETCGARVQRVADLPKIETTWEIRNDGNGFVVKLPRERFQDVNGLLRRLYGAPSLWEEKNLEGQPQGVFSPKQTGVAIQYLRTRHHTEIICIRDQLKR